MRHQPGMKRCLKAGRIPYKLRVAKQIGDCLAKRGNVAMVRCRPPRSKEAIRMTPCPHAARSPLDSSPEQAMCQRPTHPALLRHCATARLSTRHAPSPTSIICAPSCRHPRSSHHSPAGRARYEPPVADHVYHCAILPCLHRRACLRLTPLTPHAF